MLHNFVVLVMEQYYW